MNITKTPEFSWSCSRSQIFNTCRRSYWYQYYGGHNGWLDNPDITAHTIYKYRNVTNFNLVVGQGIHEVMKKAVTFKDDDYSGQDVKKWMKNYLHEACVKGSNMAAWDSKPNRNPMLQEFLYWGGFKSDKSQKVIDYVNKKLDNFGEMFKTTTTYQEIKAGRMKELIEADENMNNNNKYGSEILTFTNKHGQELSVKIWAKIDLLYIRDDGKYIITDWKTESKDAFVKEDSNDDAYFQLLVYAWYVLKKYHVSLKNIILRRENVVTGTTFESTAPSLATVSKALQRITTEVDAMSEYVVDKDIANNVSHAKESYGMISEDGHCSQCEKCKFRALCFGLDSTVAPAENIA